MKLPQPSMFKKRFMLISLCLGLLGTTTEGKFLRKKIILTLLLAKTLYGNCKKAVIMQTFDKNSWVKCLINKEDKNSHVKITHLRTEMSKLTCTERWNHLWTSGLMSFELILWSRLRFFNSFHQHQVLSNLCLLLHTRLGLLSMWLYY